MDNTVDRLDEAIKLYVTKLTRGSLDEREGRRAMEIISFAINLEHIGDIIDKNLSELAAKKIKRKLQFSSEGAAELAAFHKRILESLQARVRRVHVRRRRGGAQADRARRRSCATPSSPRPSAISSGCAKAGRRRWRRPRCISTCCATSSASTRTSARSPIRCWRPPAKCSAADAAESDPITVAVASLKPTGQ